MVHGWAAGNLPRIQVVRSGRKVVDVPLHPAPGGMFQIDLHTIQGPLALDAHDVVTVGTALHHRSFALPSLSASITSSSAPVHIRAPKGQPVDVLFGGDSSPVVAIHAVTPASGALNMVPPRSWKADGESVEVRVATQTGDIVVADAQLFNVALQGGQPGISGTALPGTTLSFRVLSPRGQVEGRAIAVADAVTGEFQTKLRALSSRPVRLRPGMRLIAQDGQEVVAGVIPRFSVRYTQSSGTVTMKAGPKSHFELQSRTPAHDVTMALNSDASGSAVAHVAEMERVGFAHFTLSLQIAPNLVVERSFAVGRKAAVSHAALRATSLCTQVKAATRARCANNKNRGL